MNATRDRLFQKLDEVNALSNVLPGRETAETVSERVAEWLTTPNAEPTCSIRVKDLLIIAGKKETALQLMVIPTTFQINDSSSPVFGEHRGGPSIVESGSPVKLIHIPLAEISGEQQAVPAETPG